MRTLPALSSLALASALAATPASALGGDDEAAFLEWKERTWTLAEAAPQLDERVSAELAQLEPWCAQHGYVAALDDAGHVVVLLSNKRRKREKTVADASAAATLFEALVPAPERDPDETFLTPDWGRGQHVPDRGSVALAVAEKAPDFESLLGLIESSNPLLSGRVTNKKGPAFYSGEAGAGALLSAPDGYELGTVWRAENELVNRLTRLLLHRRFGELPYWLDMGLAWYVEQEVRGDLYSFPGRDDFVSIHDHDGWKNDLKRSFKKRRKQPLSLAEFIDWRPGQWDAEKVAIAWGFARFLAAHPERPLSKICEDLRLDVKEGSVSYAEDGSWQLVEGYRPSAQTQNEILVRHLGEDYLEEVSAFFKSGVR